MAKLRKPARQRRNALSDYQVHRKNRQPGELPDFDLGLVGWGSQTEVDMKCNRRRMADIIGKLKDSMGPCAAPMCAEVQR
jgi:hypothetical protein